jgi:hypothetical protein
MGPFMPDLLSASTLTPTRRDSAGTTNAPELSALAIALRAKHYQRLADRRLPSDHRVWRIVIWGFRVRLHPRPAARAGQFQLGCRRWGNTPVAGLAKSRAGKARVALR